MHTHTRTHSGVCMRVTGGCWSMCYMYLLAKSNLAYQNSPCTDQLTVSLDANLLVRHAFETHTHTHKCNHANAFFFFFNKMGKRHHTQSDRLIIHGTTELTARWGSYQAPQTSRGETQKGGQACKNKAKPKIHLRVWNESYPHFHCGNFNQQPFTGRTYNLNLVLVFFFSSKKLCISGSALQRSRNFSSMCWTVVSAAADISFSHLIHWSSKQKRKVRTDDAGLISIHLKEHIIVAQEALQDQKNEINQ